MKKLLKGELISQLNFKIAFLIVLALISFFSLKNAYDYHDSLLERQLAIAKENQAMAIGVYDFLSDLEKDKELYLIEEKNKKKPNEDIEELEKDISNIETERKILINMQYNYGKMINIFDESIKNEDANISENFSKATKIADSINRMVYDQIYKKGINPQNEKLLYRDNIEDLHRRLVALETKMDLGEEITNKPTGLSMLNHQMTNIIPIFLILLIIIMNYNNWSKEFTNGHIKTLFTQPFRKKDIYIARTIISYLKTLIYIFLLFFIPIIIVGIINGWGSNIGMVINSLAIENIFSFTSDKEIFSYLIGIPIINYSFYYLSILLIYTIFIATATNLVSILIKSDFGSLVVSIIMISFLFINSKYNPFYYYRIEDLLAGKIGIGFLGAIIVLVISIILLNIFSYKLLIESSDEI